MESSGISSDIVLRTLWHPIQDVITRRSTSGIFSVFLSSPKFRASEIRTHDF